MAHRVVLLRTELSKCVCMQWHSSPIEHSGKLHYP